MSQTIKLPDVGQPGHVLTIINNGTAWVPAKDDGAELMIEIDGVHYSVPSRWSMDRNHRLMLLGFMYKLGMKSIRGHIFK